MPTGSPTDAQTISHQCAVFPDAKYYHVGSSCRKLDPLDFITHASNVGPKLYIRHCAPLFEYRTPDEPPKDLVVSSVVGWVVTWVVSLVFSPVVSLVVSPVFSPVSGVAPVPMTARAVAHVCGG
eukprot:1191708-Prorocentrum_minimum.AAC.2